MNKRPRIWLSSPHMGGEELGYISEAFATNWIAPLGPHVDAFEVALADKCGTKHCAALNSGTSAIHLALVLLGVKQDDQVICQSFTFSASANPITYVGAKPVFVDSEHDTWNMNPRLLERAIIECMGGEDSRNDAERWRDTWFQGETKIVENIEKRRNGGKKPKAIIVVHLYGMPAKMDEIRAIANKYNIPVIEDAAEALGSRYNGEPAGSLGTIGILSFNGNKIITTSGGGALLSNDASLVERARFLSSQARDNAPHYQHSQIGYNYRMSNVIAGIGLGQLKVLKQRIAQRRANNIYYREELANLPGIRFQTEPSGEYFSNYWLTAITINPRLTGGKNREDIRLALLEENVESRPLWKPLHMQPVFSQNKAIVNGTSETLFNTGLCLPSGSNLKSEDLQLVCNIIKKTIMPLKTSLQISETEPEHKSLLNEANLTKIANVVSLT